MLTVFCDGLFEPRDRADGWGCWAWIAVDEKDRTVALDKGCLGRGRDKYSSNTCEYTAVGKAVRWLVENKYTDAAIFTDSMLVVNQVNGTWQIKAEHLRKYCVRIQELMEGTKLTLQWVPRELNQLADDLTNEAYEEARA